MRILFFSLNSPGFLYPAISIALRARRSGHDVAFVCSSKAQLLLSSVGIPLVDLEACPDSASFEVPNWGKPLSIALQVKNILHASKAFRPDVCVSQQPAVGPLIASELADLPIAQIGFCTHLWPVSDVPDDSEREDRLAWRHDDQLRVMNEARLALHLPAVYGRCRTSPLIGDLLFVRSVPELESAAASLPPKVHLVGACHWPGPSTADTVTAAEWARAASANRLPVIYAEPGRVFRNPSFWPTLVKALADVPIAVAASLGRYDSESPKCPRHWLVQRHVPQDAILPFASAVVSNGTTTPALGAVTHGLPSVFVPTGGEQLDVADVFSRAGIAKSLDAQSLTAEQLRTELLAVLSNTVLRSSAERMARYFARLDGPVTVVSLLEDLVNRRQPPRCAGGSLRGASA